LRLRLTQNAVHLNALHCEAASMEAPECGLWPRYFTEHSVKSCNWNVQFMCFASNKIPRFTFIQNAGEIVLWTYKVDLQSCLKWARWLVAERDRIVTPVSVCRSDINVEMFSIYLRWPHYFFFFGSIFISRLVLAVIVLHRIR